MLSGALMFAALLLQPVRAAEFWVASDGVAGNPGTRAAPLPSVADGLRKARELRRLSGAPMENPVRIVVRGGTYRLTSPLLVRPEDSGTESSPTIIETASAERPVLSGGVAVQNWRKPMEAIVGLPAAAQGQA